MARCAGSAGLSPANMAAATMQSIYTGDVEVKTEEPVTEDYRSDRIILEQLSLELARLHRRLDGYEERYNHWQKSSPFNLVSQLVGRLGAKPHA